MTDCPETIAKIIRECTTLCPNDITKAKALAKRRISQAKDYQDWIEFLVDVAITRLVSDVRHTANVEIRRANGEYGGPAKVGMGGGAVNRAAARSLLKSYFINGRTLGSILGKELPVIASSETARGNGCLFNAALCEALKPMVG